MHSFTVNGKEYKTVPFDFNVICDLEDLGVPIEKAGDKPISMLRAYFAICGKMSVEEAGLEISKHLQNGGDMDTLSDAMSAEIDESDFFRTLSQGA